MPPISIIEHLLLLKVRDSTDPPTIAGMLSSLRSLSSLPLFPHLAAGPIRLLSSPSPLLFTHLLHIRFLSQPALAAYSTHPLHLAAVQRNAATIQDILALDWAADLAGDLVPSPGSALLFLIAKPKEGTPPAEIVKAVRALRASKGTCGVNLAPERAKGYEVGLVLEEAMDGEVHAIEEGIRDLVDSVLALEFVVPPVGEGLSS